MVKRALDKMVKAWKRARVTGGDDAATEGPRSKGLPATEARSE